MTGKDQSLTGEGLESANLLTSSQWAQVQH